jgi:hypothetical protein
VMTASIAVGIGARCILLRTTWVHGWAARLQCWFEVIRSGGGGAAGKAECEERSQRKNRSHGWPPTSSVAGPTSASVHLLVRRVKCRAIHLGMTDKFEVDGGSLISREWRGGLRLRRLTVEPFESPAQHEVCRVLWILYIMRDICPTGGWRGLSTLVTATAIFDPSCHQSCQGVALREA